MSTHEMIDELIVVHYAPNLDIIGMLHSLNDHDKGFLEDIIKESNFVALEYDDHRAETSGWFTPVLSPEISGFNKEDGKFYVNKTDSFYLKLFAQILKYNIMRANVETGGKRDSSITEFEYSIEIADKYNKDLLLVDMPVHEIILKLLQMPLSGKIQHLLSEVFDFVPIPKRADEILHKDREDYMLNEIEKYKGPINDLKEKGILVVGYTHAKNYLKRIE